MEKSLRQKHESRSNFYGSFKGPWHLKCRLLLANLKSSGLEPTALKRMENYLTGRFQRTKIVIVIVQALK